MLGTDDEDKQRDGTLEQFEGSAPAPLPDHRIWALVIQ